MRFQSPESVIEEIEYLIKDYNTQYIAFFDDDFFIDKNRAVKFCELLMKKNIKIPWRTLVRPDSLSEDILKIAVKAGCKRLTFGFESGSQRILDVMNKKSNVERNLSVVNLCRKYNVEVVGLFMIGNPTETKHDADLTWKFVKKANLDVFGIGATIPFPGTTLWKWCKDKGHISEGIDFSTFQSINTPIQIPDTFTPEQVQNIKTKFLIKAFLLCSRLRKRFFLFLIKHPFHICKVIFAHLPFIRRKRIS